MVAGVLLLPLGITAYPSVGWRHPVDFVAWVTIGGAGVVACLSLPDEDIAMLMGLISRLRPAGPYLVAASSARRLPTDAR